MTQRQTSVNTYKIIKSWFLILSYTWAMLSLDCIDNTKTLMATSKVTSQTSGWKSLDIPEPKLRNKLHSTRFGQCVKATTELQSDKKVTGSNKIKFVLLLPIFIHGNLLIYYL